jgi:hypothetical protein
LVKTPLLLQELYAVQVAVSLTRRREQYSCFLPLSLSRRGAPLSGGVRWYRFEPECRNRHSSFPTLWTTPEPVDCVFEGMAITTMIGAKHHYHAIRKRSDNAPAVGFRRGDYRSNS